jgi:hypothetical protein
MLPVPPAKALSSDLDELEAWMSCRSTMLSFVWTSNNGPSNWATRNCPTRWVPGTTPLHLHLGRKRKLYVTGKIYRIDAEPITSQAAFVTDYGGKAIKRRRFSNDHVLLLPRTVAELPAKKYDQAENVEAKGIKDIQSSMNVSEAVARSIYQARTSHKRQ